MRTSHNRERHRENKPPCRQGGGGGGGGIVVEKWSDLGKQWSDLGKLHGQTPLKCETEPSSYNPE